MFKKIFSLSLFLFTNYINSQQNTISGTIYNEYLESFPNAKITCAGTSSISDINGKFTLKTTKLPPLTLKINAEGHQSEEINITAFEKNVNVVLKKVLSVDEIVVSASRIPERIIESPVAIERYSLSKIKQTPSVDFYDGLANLKSVDARPISYGFSSLNTRGFADFNNSRFVQFVDGVDTAVPSVNYTQGNLSGVSDLDIKDIEVLAGASSTLYGANAYNGLMLLTTKNPFDFGGASAIIKSGVTQQKAGGTNPFYDISVRLAHQFNDYFAAKVNFGYYNANEWVANDYRGKDPDTRELDGKTSESPTYDGLNIYGDGVYAGEVTAAYSGDPNEGWLYRTGYYEKDFLDTSRLNNLKFSTGFYIRPVKNNSLEIQLGTDIGMYSGMAIATSRYYRKDFYQERSKLEVKNEDFYVRAYLSRVVSDKIYSFNALGGIMNISSVINQAWTSAFNENYTQTANVINARNYADNNFRPQVGSPAFNSIASKLKTTLLTERGAALYDHSRLIHTDGNYDFRRLLNNWADIQIGGAYRRYSPKSKGTIFNDAAQSIKIKEYGIYTQIQKKLLNERLKATGSVRYDKSTNFEGHFSPRLTANYTLDKNKNHVVRVSYQTAFRNPSLREQYLFTKEEGSLKLSAGAIKDNLDRISFSMSNDFDKETYTFTGNQILDNALNQKTYYGTDYYLPENGNVVSNIKMDLKELRSETLETFELGYRSLVLLSNSTNLDIDFNAFYSKHKDFIYSANVIIPGEGKIYPYGIEPSSEEKVTEEKEYIKDLINTYISEESQESSYNRYSQRLIRNNVILADRDAIKNLISEGYKEATLMVNAPSDVTSYGFGLGLETKFLKDFEVIFSYDYIDFDYKKDLSGFEPNFNTPNHTVRLGLGNQNIFKNFGFNITGRWTSEYRWVSQFVNGDIDARTVLDAQINYRIPKMKSTFKIGGTNLLNKEYFVAPGMGQIGTTYHISWIINN